MSAPYRYIPMSFFDSLADARKKMHEQSLVALEAQLEQVEWMDRSSNAVPAYQHFVNVYGGRKLSGAQRDVQGLLLHQAVHETVSTAPTYYVSPDMSEMVKQAADVMISNEGLTPTIIPSEKGFLLFSRPMPIDGPDHNDETSSQMVQISAIAWRQEQVHDPHVGTTVPGVVYYLFSNAHDMAVAMNLINQKYHPDDESLLVTESDMKKSAGPFPIYDFSGWAYGKPWNSVPYDDSLGDVEIDDTHVGTMVEGVMQVHPVVDQARRLLLATWSMLSQTVTKIQTEEPPRYLRRRASRFMPETGDIVVIRLRREVTEGLKRHIHPDDADIPWYNHRFLVRGHWRRQPYGPGRSETKLTWIAPYVKGPEDAPLVVRDKIYSLEA